MENGAALGIQHALDNMPQIGRVGSGLEALLVAVQFQRTGRTEAKLLEPMHQLLSVSKFLDDVPFKGLSGFADAQTAAPHRVDQIVLHGLQFGRTGLFEQRNGKPRFQGIRLGSFGLLM